MKVYLVTEKTFYKWNNVEYQISDQGITPMVFTSKNRAEKEFTERIQEHGGKWTEVQLFPFTSWQWNYTINNIEYRKIYSILETETC